MPKFSASPGRPANRLLELLPEADFDHLMTRAERVTLPLREMVAQPGEPSPHAYFPLTSVFSMVVPLRDGSAIETATIGSDGMAGIDLLLDWRASIYQSVQQVEGESLRVPAEFFKDALAAHESLRRIVEQYLFTVLHQSAQSAVCNQRHTIEERMARWLLMTQDRVGKDEFYLTQEFLGIMLGVRRQSVSLTAAMLQQAGLIAYTRGNMKILDRGGLEQTSCECYEAVRSTYEQIMQSSD